MDVAAYTSAFPTVPMYSLAQSSRLFLGSSELRVRGMSPNDEVRPKRANLVSYCRAIHAAEVVSCSQSLVNARYSPSALLTFLESHPRNLALYR